MNKKRCSINPVFKKTGNYLSAKNKLFLGLLLILLLAGTVFAAEPSKSKSSLQKSVEKIVQNVVDVVYPLASAILGQEATDSEFFFARILFFIVILMVFYLALGKIPVLDDNTFVSWIISISIAVVASRYFVSDAWIKTIILPYTTLGIAITAILPFVVWFMIVNISWKEHTTPLIRKTLWIFFGIIFLGLWTSRYEEIPDEVWIYPVTAVAGFIMAIMDGTVHKFFTRVTIEKSLINSKKDRIRELKRERIQLDKDLITGVVQRPEYDKRKKEMDHLLLELSKA